MAVMKKSVFIKQSRIAAPVADVFRWHARTGALERLTPPWSQLKVLGRDGDIRDGDITTLKMKAGPMPYTWIARHEGYQKNVVFKDRQIKGPFKHWVHRHGFKPGADGVCVMEDRIEYALPFSPISRALAGQWVQKDLEEIFDYRHRTLAWDMAEHKAFPGKKPLNIVITGASGLIGSVLRPFLSTGGHRVFRLVRQKPVSEDELFWDPRKGRIDLDKIGPVDVIIHLAGENLATGRWTTAKRRRIMESRTRSTKLIAETAINLNPRPKVLVSASAIGYYGDRGPETLSEKSDRGSDFISEVCERWEKAAAPVEGKGIRTVFMRIGVVLTPRGGALKKMLPVFKSGFGGRLGSGKQVMSWVGIDDVIGAIYHAIGEERLEGPVNVVSPFPVTNARFSKTLGKVVRRPVLLRTPETAIKAVFGQMGKEIVLSSTRVLPEKLLSSGYRFRTPDLEETLRHLLGGG